MIGLVGIAGGVLFGLAINALLGQIGLDYGSYSGIADYMALINGRVYPSLGLEQLPKRTITIGIICALAALYPAIEASRREPAEALHYV